MGPRELLRWQWEGYPRYHTTRGNLLLHLCTVPLFWAGTVLLVTAALTPSGPPAAFGAGCLLAALIAQGRGHKLEPTPPAPFTGPWNFVARFCLEQWVNFPRFLLTGGWWRNLRASR